MTGTGGGTPNPPPELLQAKRAAVYMAVVEYIATGMRHCPTVAVMARVRMPHAEAAHLLVSLVSDGLLTRWWVDQANGLDADDAGARGTWCYRPSEPEQQELF